MNAKTTAARAKRSDRVMDQLVKRMEARSHRDGLSGKYHALNKRLELLTWMDRTPAERRREIARLSRETHRTAVAWLKAHAKCERLSAK